MSSRHNFDDIVDKRDPESPGGAITSAELPSFNEALETRTVHKASHDIEEIDLDYSHRQYLACLCSRSFGLHYLMPVGFGGAKEELRGAIPLYSDNEQSSGHVDTSPILDGEQMEHRNLAITSRGSLVPGSITIPSDGAAHNVLVAQLELAAGMSWVVVPKVDAIARLKAKINNASDHTLLPGIASVYVNGSFISRLGVPLVNPFESFDCRLEKVSRSGFYTKTSNQVFTQRITVLKTKFITTEYLKVIEQLPISENSQIVLHSSRSYKQEA